MRDAVLCGGWLCPILRVSQVDALTADVAFRHADSEARGLALVTAGHYHCRTLARTDLDRDLHLRCYVTSTGRSSLEV